MGNEDVSIIKHFPIHEGHMLEFRMEMFNAPNHVLLSTPGSLSWNGSSAANGQPGYGAPSTFGTITSTLSAMRQIQFALKYAF
jgi:hypothetical protein